MRGFGRRTAAAIALGAGLLLAGSGAARVEDTPESLRAEAAKQLAP